MRLTCARGVLGVALLLLAGSFVVAAGDDDDRAIVPQLSKTPTAMDSTVPQNGDLNPYGVAFVPDGFPVGGKLSPGDILVSNFNNSTPPTGLQGTGTTIVRVHPNTAPSLFFQSTPVGLSTALGVLQAGFVIVGNLPSTDGSGNCVAESGPDQNVGAGSLQVIDRYGHLRKSITNPKMLNGPWDLTIQDYGDRAVVFVSNALSGAVTRLELRISSDSVAVENETQIASGYVHRCDPAAFVVGPTGLALDSQTDTLFVSSTGDNAIFAVQNASSRQNDEGTGAVFIRDRIHLHGPLALALAANGDLISAQGDAVNPNSKRPSEIVEFDRFGEFVAEHSIDSTAGSAFGLAIQQFEDGFTFAAVDDNLNVLDVWQVN